jgi:hypothetical protein
MSNPRVFATGDRPTEAATGDFNRDGSADLAILLSGQDRIAIYFGDGQGGFTPGESYAAGNLPRGLGATDIDGDGNVDLVVGNALGDLMTFRGLGDGAFDTFLRSGGEMPLAVADLDGDGIPEVVVANASLDRVSVQQPDGVPTTDGALAASQVFEQQRAEGLLAPGAVELADLNGDGRADMLVANRGGNELLVYLGRGDGTFDDARSFYAGTNPSGITVVDVNGDARLDVVVANAGSNDVSVLLGDANELLRAGPRLAAGIAPVATEAGDFDGDGRTDLLVANSGADTVSLLLGIGGGFFNDKQALVFPTGADPRSLLVGQFDGRPGADLVTVNARGGSLTFYSNFLGGALNPTTIATGGLRPTSAVTQDFNADGRLDLVVANNASGSLSVLLGSDTGLSLGTIIADLGFDHPSSLELIDFGGETGLRLLVTHEGDEQPHLFTPKDFLSSEAGQSAPGGASSGLLLTLFQTGFRLLASSAVALPTVSPAVAEFLAQFLGDAASDQGADTGLAIGESDSFAQQMRATGAFVAHAVDEVLDSVVAALNVTLNTQTTKAEVLAALAAMVDWMMAGNETPTADGESLAHAAAKVVKKLDATAADAVLADMETPLLTAPEVMPDIEQEPKPFAAEMSRELAPPIEYSKTPVTPAALEEPVSDALSTPPAGRVDEPVSNQATWPWQLWAAAVVLGSVALGAGGFVTHRHWRRRSLELLGEE